MMDLRKLVVKDWRRFTSNEWGTDFTIENKKGVVVSSRGLSSLHHLGVDANGMPVNAKNIHLQINEQDLIDKCYPTRNENGDIDLLYHIITFKDNIGEEHKYIINETMPDHNVGAIICTLGDYE